MGQRKPNGKYCKHKLIISNAYHCLLELIWFDASYEEGMTVAQLLHQRIERLFELCAQCWRLLSRIVTLKWCLDAVRAADNRLTAYHIEILRK